MGRVKFSWINTAIVKNNYITQCKISPKLDGRCVPRPLSQATSRSLLVFTWGSKSCTTNVAWLHQQNNTPCRHHIKPSACMDTSNSTEVTVNISHNWWVEFCLIMSEFFVTVTTTHLQDLPTFVLFACTAGEHVPIIFATFFFICGMLKMKAVTTDSHSPRMFTPPQTLSGAQIKPASI